MNFTKRRLSKKRHLLVAYKLHLDRLRTVDSSIQPPNENSHELENWIYQEMENFSIHLNKVSTDIEDSENSTDLSQITTSRKSSSQSQLVVPHSNLLPIHRLSRIPPLNVILKRFSSFVSKDEDTSSSSSFLQVKLRDVKVNSSTLSLCAQNIVYLTKNIVEFSSITVLELCCNVLTQIPSEIGQLTKLKTLSLSGNLLTSLPSSLDRLSSLKVLRLSNNRLTQVPDVVCDISNLRGLYIDRNQISELPRGLCRLTKLESLDVSGNPIHAFPASLGKLEFLRHVLASNCDLKVSKKRDRKSKFSKVLSLKEIAARAYLSHSHPLGSINSSQPILSPPPLYDDYVWKDLEVPELNSYLLRYLKGARQCHHCLSPYIDNFVVRNRIISRAGIRIPLEYRLCSSHWNNNKQRIKQLFCTVEVSSLSSTLTPTIIEEVPIFEVPTRPTQIIKRRFTFS